MTDDDHIKLNTVGFFEFNVKLRKCRTDKPILLSEADIQPLSEITSDIFYINPNFINKEQEDQ